MLNYQAGESFLRLNEKLAGNGSQFAENDG
jgi:hypothetical protein